MRLVQVPVCLTHDSATNSVCSPPHKGEGSGPSLPLVPILIHRNVL
jgi:hypothetical protein